MRPRPDPAAAVDRWVAAFARRGVERLQPEHAFDLMGLIDQLGPTPDTRGDPKRSAGLRASRLAMAHAVLRWCPSPERLGRWLRRALRRWSPTNLAGYLRVASRRGDPGTVLALEGRRGDDVRDFCAATEAALRGPYYAQVRALLAAGATIVREVDPEQREELRRELAHYWTHGRTVAARVVLLRLVGPSPTDAELEPVVACVLPLAEARRLVAA